MRIIPVCCFALLFVSCLFAQPPGNGAVEERERRLVDQFDQDEDGVLNEQERKLAREFVKANPRRAGGRGPGGRGPGGRGPGGRGPGGPTDAANAQPNERGLSISPDDVTNVDAPLYDESVLRTLFLEFDNEDWEDELADFYRTDVLVPADLTVDGKTYSPIGVAFRGNSSFFSISKGQKRSFNLVMDYGGKKQDLLGYRSLNLLNSHSDASFLREVTFNHVARDYTAAPQANFVRLVINGESWGVYGNAQQANKELMEEWFDSRQGARWKVSPGPGSEGSSLTFNGPDAAAYAGYQLKSKSTDKALPDLIEFCRVLNETPVNQLHEKLESVMSVDCALWFLALDNALIDTDGYYARGSDYLLYQHPDDGRFHVLIYDSNETFRTSGGGGGGPRGPRGGNTRGGFRGPGGGNPEGGFRGPGGRNPEGGFRGPGGGNPEGGFRGPGGRNPEGGFRGPGGGNPEGGPDDNRQGPDARNAGTAPQLNLDPFAGRENEQLALLNRLLANPIIRARYVAHVRTITNEWLDWERMGPVIEGYHQLIHDEVKADTRKLYPFDDFLKNLTEGLPGRRPLPGLKSFVEERGDFLRKHPEVSKSHPIMTNVTHETTQRGSFVSATITGDVIPEQVILYHAPARHLRFEQVSMLDDGKHNDGAAGDGIYGGQLPDNGRTYYYVEARKGGDVPITVFYPTNTERGSIEFVPDLRIVENSPVVISEIMAINKATLKDPQGDFDDWIEVHNRSDESIDLSGKFLSDSKSNPRKWAFPEETVIGPGDYLLVWADEDEAKIGLHANFKLSKEGESVLLIDTDGVSALDTVSFETLSEDVAFGRSEGSEKWSLLRPTPGQANSGTDQ